MYDSRKGPHFPQRREVLSPVSRQSLSGRRVLESSSRDGCFRRLFSQVGIPQQSPVQEFDEVARLLDGDPAL